MAIGPKQATELTPQDVMVVQEWEQALDLAISQYYRPNDGRATFYGNDPGVQLPTSCPPEDGRVWKELIRRYTAGDDPWISVYREVGPGTALFIFSK